MTWGEFKEYVEGNGVDDDMEILSIDIYRADGDPEVEVKKNEVTIYQ